MEDLPVEILHPIFLQACTDGGRTGRSLALTSRYIHAASRAIRFHSVSLVSGSSDQVVQFLDCFTNARATAQAIGEDVMPAVHHFCLVAAQNSLPQEMRVASPGTVPDKSGRETPRTPAKAAHGVSGVFTQEEHRYFEAIVALIRLIAPDLERLCLIDDEDARRCDAVLHIPMLQSAGFPRLVELVTVGREPAGWRTSDACTPFYPRLRTYQRVLQPEFCPWGFRPPREPKVERWREVAPKLIDLHVFEIGYKRNVPDLCWALLEHPAMHLSSELRELVARCPPVPPPPPRRRRDRLACSEGADIGGTELRILPEVTTTRERHKSQGKGVGRENLTVVFTLCCKRAHSVDACFANLPLAPIYTPKN